MRQKKTDLHTESVLPYQVYDLEIELRPSKPLARHIRIGPFEGDIFSERALHVVNLATHRLDRRRLGKIYAPQRLDRASLNACGISRIKDLVAGNDLRVTL